MVVTPMPVVPVPDPTKLTQEAVDRLEKNLSQWIGANFDAIRKDILRLEEVVHQRPAAMATELQHFRDVVNERFNSISMKFADNETALNAALTANRTLSEERSKSNQAATAKAETGFTNEITSLKATIAAVQKSQDEKIEGVKALIATTMQGATDKIDDVRNRVGAIENVKKGATENWGVIMGGVSLIVALIAIIGGIAGFYALRPAVSVEQSSAPGAH